MVYGCRLHHRTASRPRDPLMACDGTPGLRLPDAAKAVVWRIFGSGESPLTGRTTYELIEPIIKRYVAAADQDLAIAQICNWFESHGERRWLKSDMGEAVAALILEEVRSERSETAIWAVGSINADFAASYIRSCWERLRNWRSSVIKTMFSMRQELPAFQDLIPAPRFPEMQ